MYKLKQKMHYSVLILSPLVRVLAFVQDIADNNNHKLIVQAIISIAKSLNKRTGSRRHGNAAVEEMSRPGDFKKQNTFLLNHDDNSIKINTRLVIQEYHQSV